MLSSPVPLTAEHDVDAFHSGQAVLDNWLRHRALANQSTGASRTYVVCEALRVVAFHALAPGAIAQAAASGKFRRNMPEPIPPEPIPAVVLARMAVDLEYQGRGLGGACSGTQHAGWSKRPTQSGFAESSSKPFPKKREAFTSPSASTHPRPTQ